jgi:tight adherence protein B
MLLMVLSICVGSLAAAVLVATMVGKGASKPAVVRLAALDHEFAPTDYEEKVTDIRKQQRRLSAIPLLNHWLTKLNLGPASTLYLYQAGVNVTLGTLVLTSIAGFAFLGYILDFRFGATLPSLLIAAGVLPLPFLYVRHMRTKRLSKLEQQLPEALGMMVSALRVGHSLIASLGAVAQDCHEPISGEIRKCFEEQN